MALDSQLSTLDFSEQDRTALRCAAFVSEFPQPLCDPSDNPLGPRVVALTPWRHNLLFLYRSPFVTGSATTRNQLLQALWILSPDYVPGSRFRFALFCWRFWWMPAQPATIALRLWIRAQLIDRPPAPLDSRPSTLDSEDEPDPLWFASFIVARMLELRWSEDEVLHCPYSRLFQYASVLQEARSGDKKPRFNHKRDQAAKARLMRRLAARGSVPS